MQVCCVALVHTSVMPPEQHVKPVARLPQPLPPQVPQAAAQHHRSDAETPSRHRLAEEPASLVERSRPTIPAAATGRRSELNK